MNDSTKDALNTIFDVATSNSDTPTAELVSTAELLPVAPIVSEETEPERLAREDFEFSRGALKSVAVESQNTLHRAVEVAEQTDTPRAFEAVAVMVRATLDSHKELHDLHEKAAKARAIKTATTTSTTEIGRAHV